MEQSALDIVPDHVPENLVFPLDFYALCDDLRLADDTQTGLTFLHREAPDVRGYRNARPVH